MHEWALAEAVVSTMLSVAKENGANKVVEAKIKLGKLQQIEVSVFTFALKELTKKTLLEKTNIKLDHEEARFGCRACGLEWSFNDSAKAADKAEAEAMHFVPDLVHAFIRCPRCGSPDFKIIGGRGICIEYIKISK